ncbi:MAG TPA: glycosyltransferase family 2 protein [Myxococcales bacterium]|nr:glycosyltransferase family 2 protein [Myxococcales bacterium]
MIRILLELLAVPPLAAAGYLLLLTLFSRRAPAARGRGRTRFDVVIPAHDEERGIARTVRSILETDYAADLRRVLVVADNCSDSTAAHAAAAGARVLVRDDPERRGKGRALAFAFERSLADGFADAIVVVDADSAVSPNLLSAFAARLERGALAVQAGPAVLNRDDSCRTRLMSLALALFNGVRSLGRDNLGLSCGLRGNGMCIATTVLRAHPYGAFSLVEDLEYGIELARAGIRVEYAGETAVASEMVSESRSAASQRRRWEQGRASLSRQLLLPLLRNAFARRSLLLLDAAVDLLVPPLSSLVLALAAGLGVALFASAPAWPWLAGLAFVAIYVARGWSLSGLGFSGLRALAWTPFYVMWKVSKVSRATPTEWVRTAREAGAS